MAADRATIAWDRGFTLIEMLMTVAIAAIVAAVLLPLISSVDTFGLPYAAQMLATDLEYAQAEAIRTQRTVRVDFNVDSETYDVYFADTGVRLTHPLTGGDMTIDIRDVTDQPDLDIVSATVDGSSASFAFSPTGEPVGATDGETISGARSIVLGLDSRSVMIEIVPIVGTVRITEL